MQGNIITVSNIKEYIDIKFAIISLLKWICLSISENKEIEYNEFRNFKSLVKYYENLKNITFKVMILEVEGYPKPTYQNTRFDFWVINKQFNEKFLFQKELSLNGWLIKFQASSTVQRKIEVKLSNSLNQEISGVIYPKENRHKLKFLYGYDHPYFTLVSIWYFIAQNDLMIRNDNLISVNNLQFKISTYIEKSDKKAIELSNDKTPPIKNIKSTLIRFIKENRLEDFFNYIHNKCKVSSQLLNDIIVLENKYQRIKREKRVNIIANVEYDVSLSQLVNSCIEIVDDIDESSFESVKGIESRVKLKNDLSNQNIEALSELNKKMEKRIESDYKLFEIFDLHNFYENALALIDVRSKAKKIININLANINLAKEKYKLDKIALVNVDTQKRDRIINYLEVESEKIFNEFEKQSIAEVAIGDYEKLIYEVNEMIKESIT